MKYLLFIAFLLSISFTANSKEYQLNCKDFSNDIQLISCLLELNPSITSISMAQTQNSQPNIEPLATFLPQNPQLTSIRLELHNVQSTAPLLTCFKGLTNITSLEINFFHFWDLNQNDLEVMFTDQYQSLNNFLLSLYYTSVDLIPVSNVIGNMTNLESLYLNVEPKTNNTNPPVVQNLDKLNGIFENNTKIKNISFFIQNNDWSKKQIKDLTQIFKGVNTLQYLQFSFESNNIEDASVFEDIFKPITEQLETLKLQIQSNPLKNLKPIKNMLDSQKNLKTLQIYVGRKNVALANEDEAKQYFQSMESFFTGLNKLELLEFYLYQVNGSPQNLNFSYMKDMFALPQLKDLKISFQNDMQITSLDNFDTVTNGLDNLQRLQILFSYNRIPSEQLDNLHKALKNTPNLTYLNLNFIMNTIVDTKYLSSVFQDLTKLEELYLNLESQLGQVGMTSTDGMQSAFQALKSLKTLNLNFSSNKINNIEDLKAALESIQQIEAFNGNFGFNCLPQSDDFYQNYIRNALPNTKNIVLDFQSQGGSDCKKQQEFIE